jgi:hypothetical protein
VYNNLNNISNNTKAATGRIAAPSGMPSAAAWAGCASAGCDPGRGSGSESMSASSAAGATAATGPTGSGAAAGTAGDTFDTSGGKDRGAMAKAK